jgi:hypothetical protein
MMQDGNGPDSDSLVPVWYLAPVSHSPFQILTEHYCFVKIWMQDTGCTMQDRKGSDLGYLVPGTWYLTPVPNSPISNLNKALPPEILDFTQSETHSTGLTQSVGLFLRSSGNTAMVWHCVPGCRPTA